MWGEGKFEPEKDEEEKGDVTEVLSDFFKGNEFGIDEKNFSERMPELIEKEKTLETVSSTVKSYEEIFNNMPLELHEAIKSFYSNESDWDRHVKDRISLDFGKDFESLDAKDVVSKYFPGKITEEEWEEYNDPDGDEREKKAVSSYIDVSKEKFRCDKKSYNSRVEEAKRSSSAFQENFQKSFDGSRGYLEEVSKEKMPDKLYLDTVDQEIKSGKIKDLFYTTDEVLKPEAHRNYSIARDGFELGEKQREAIKREIASREREQILMRTTDSPMVTKTSSTVESAEKELERRATERLNKIMPKIDESTF